MQERILFETLPIYKLPSWDSEVSEAGHRRYSGRRSRRKGGQMARTLFYSFLSFWINGKECPGGFQSSVLSVPKLFPTLSVPIYFNIHCDLRISMSRNFSYIERSATKHFISSWVHYRVSSSVFSQCLERPSTHYIARESTSATCKTSSTTPQNSSGPQSQCPRSFQALGDL
jgi:hypothetical protein